jgi:hypothetical protein
MEISEKYDSEMSLSLSSSSSEEEEKYDDIPNIDLSIFKK